jgi:plastocyanin domain-containing protein
MSGTELLVVAGAVSGIAWVNWYFFLARRPAAVAVAGAGGVQEVTVAVKGGYEPAVLRVRRGEPVRITFDRQETSGCSEEVVFPDFGVRRFLPAFERTTVELVPEEAGTFGFTCGMSMLQGRLVVEEVAS